jgi:thymidylate synthase (FAD)
MKILQNKGQFKILAIMVGIDGKSPLELIEWAGRTSYKSHHKINKDSAKKFVEMIRNLGHESVLEHSCMTVEFTGISRGFTHELVRHRIASYTQQSTRYVDKSEFTVIAPLDKNLKEKVVELNLPNKTKIKISFKDWVNLNEQMYRGLRQAGWVAQDARQILPDGIDAPIVMTANLREWRHVFRLRCDKAAHWEIRYVMIKLLKAVKRKIPVIFDDFIISSDNKTAEIKK